MKDVDLSEFRSAFLSEAEDLLAIANRELLAIETALRQGEGHARAARELFRAIHTLKGLSAMVGVEPIVLISHRLESALRDANAGRVVLTLPAIETMLQALRAIALRVNALSQNAEVASPPAALLEALELLDGGHGPVGPAQPLVGQLDAFLEQKLGPAEREQLIDGVRKGQRALQIDFVPSPARSDLGVNITSVRERVAKLADIVKVIPRSLPVSEAVPAGLMFVLVVLSSANDADIAQATSTEPGAIRTLPLAPNAPVAAIVGEESDEVETGNRSLIRVEIARIDEAMERMSDLIVTRYKLQRAVKDLAARGAVVRELEEILSVQGRQLRDLRAAILSVRMVTVADVLDRVPLLVRGLARSTGKQVRLELDVGRTEVDKTVAERIFPAIVHLVRNAVDHALELPAERVARKKPEKGLIRLRCVDRSNTQLELTVEDDGAGVDAVAVARRSGRPQPKNDTELLELLCLPGMSTRTETTTTSGRGMGMDIVRSVVVDQLGGELALKTHPGEGTCFTLRVPLTISIVDAFTFESGHERYAVPVASIDEVLDVDLTQVVYGPETTGVERIGMLAWRGQTLPFIVLAKRLGRPVEESARKAFVARRNGEAIAFAVERLLGQQEVVVRPLDDVLVHVPGITGTTDLGDGRPTLMVDLYALAGRAPVAEKGRAA